jgi:hypothetical protein
MAEFCFVAYDSSARLFQFLETSEDRS